jgi:hypothetical protein
MKSKSGSRIFWLLICALLLSLIFPIVAGGQGRWYRERTRTRAVIVYGSPRRPYPVYRTRSYYYQPRVFYEPRPYYDRYYQSYGYWYAPIRRRHHDGSRIRFRW